MIISVKKKHIKAGTKCDGISCPIALALNEAGVKGPELWGMNFPYVGLESIQTDLGYHQLSRNAQRFIRKFDKTGKGKPFTFKLDLSTYSDNYCDFKEMR